LFLSTISFFPPPIVLVHLTSFFVLAFLAFIMGDRELRSARASSPSRGRKRVQSNAEPTSTKRTRTTTKRDEKEDGSEGEVGPQAVKRTTAKGKRGVKGKKPRYVV